MRGIVLGGVARICAILASFCPKELDKRKRKVRVMSCFMRKINS
jgi:hypothetical protein